MLRRAALPSAVKMRITLNIALVVSAALLSLSPSQSARAQRPTPKEVALEKKVDILTDEVQRLKEKLVIPEKEIYKSVYGLGPAASKVYLLQQGLSVGGYGELLVDRILKDKRRGEDWSTGDALRYIQYLGYKFSDKWVMNAELEIEHAGLVGQNYEGKSGAVELEFAYLDYLAHPALSLRLGLMLVPMGFINEIHEPPFFHGVLRPAVETVVIPSTWRELGLGIFGEPLPGLSYKLYLVTGFDASRFSPTGWRDGRQSGNRALTENMGVTARVDYKNGDLVSAGASMFWAGADQERIPNVHTSTFLGEGHVQVRWRGLELRGLFAYGTLSNSENLTQALFPTLAEVPETRVLASDLYGYYGELAYDFWPLVAKSNLYLAPYFRYERFNTQFRTGALAGRAADRTQDVTIFEAGLTFKPHPQIVLKLSYRDTSNAADLPVADTLYFGAGFIY